MTNPGNTGLPAVCVDMGTTNTRVWLVRGAEILARAQAGVGVRDTARDGSPARIRAALRQLIEEVRKPLNENGTHSAPSFVAAAGMITSPLGLAEVPHISGPAGVSELAASVKRCHFPDVTDLPILLVPGVRCGEKTGPIEAVSQSDVMRGEETLCLGLVALGLARPPATILNLGSHWKAIQLDGAGRIRGSITSLSGELLHAAQTQTILASAVPQTRPAEIDVEWCEAGMSEQRRSGLARALFCVRLSELQGGSTPEQRLAFLVGAFIAADLDALMKRGAFDKNSPVCIAAGGAVADAWKSALEKVSIPASRLTDAEIEAGLLGGLRCIVDALDGRA
jgi:2-dehydro-3-deoxygalactonokinase